MSGEASRLDDKKESLQGSKVTGNNRGVIVGGEVIQYSNVVANGKCREVYFSNAPCLSLIPRLP
jgi:hypothetical protein